MGPFVIHCSMIVLFHHQIVHLQQTVYNDTCPRVHFYQRCAKCTLVSEKLSTKLLAGAITSYDMYPRSYHAADAALFETHPKLCGRLDKIMIIKLGITPPPPSPPSKSAYAPQMEISLGCKTNYTGKAFSRVEHKILV